MSLVALTYCLRGSCFTCVTSVPERVLVTDFSVYTASDGVRVTWALRIYGERRCGTSTNHLGDGAAHSGFTEWTVKLSAGLLAALSDTVWAAGGSPSMSER